MSVQPTSPGESIPVSPGQVFRFWAPLASTLLLMAIEAPIATAFITRRPDPELNLAAFGVAFSIGVLSEAPVLRFLTAAISLVKDRQSYISFQRFVFWQIAISTLFAAALAFDPLYSILTKDLMGLSPELRALVQPAILIWISFPALVGYRRFLQGILIRAQSPRRVAQGTTIRLIFTVVGLAVASLFPGLSGATVAVVGICIGVTAELVASLVFVRCAIRDVCTVDQLPGTTPLTFWKSSVFYYPLALSTFVLLCSQPLESFFVAQSKFPIQSLALIPVLHGLLNPFTWSGYAIQDTALAFLNRSTSDLAAVRTFAYRLGTGLAFLLSVVVLSPLATYWFAHFNGISAELLELIRIPAFLILFQPSATVWKAYLRANLINENKTLVLLANEFLEVFVFAACLFVFTRWTTVTGITAVALSGFFNALAGCVALSVYLKRTKPNSERN